MCCGADLFLGLLAVLFPPLAVWVKRGLCSADSLINILLCCLGYVPGLLHAWYIIAKFPEASEPAEYQAIPQDQEGGRVGYAFRRRQPDANPSAPHDARAQQPHPQAGMNYGTADNGEGASHDPSPPPPTYAEAVKGEDVKIQNQNQN
ncbi:putative stress response RCI peptide [Xylariaceae sp. FL0016]|nr:putative stress response RCI peptide [Xylariaceae sp. FL0016]